MAERKSPGSSSHFNYLFFLGLILLSTCCSGESHVAYDVALPSSSFVVSDIVSHPRLRRDVNNVTQLSNVSVTPGPAVNSTGTTTLTPAPSDGGNSSNDNSSNSTNNPATQNGTSTAVPTTKDPLEGAPIIEDLKDYYVVKSNIRNFDEYWTELGDGATKHIKLSKSHRVAAVIHLGFKFPFYGHLVDNITVATGGFIYMSPFLHQWLTATQYIAPLMANFDLSISSDSNIYYMRLEDSFHVEWRSVMLQDQNDTGSFTFQVILNATGEITFVYKDVPFPVSDISDLKHPVKIGVSDAYYNDTYIPQLNMRRRTIYEYHRVSVNMERVKSKTVVILQPLPTCNILTDCTTCTEHKGVNFDCQWCNTIGRCSDGLDWYRQHWDRYGCQRSKTANPAICQRYTSRRPVATSTSTSSTSTSATVSASSPHSESTSTPVERKTTQMNQSPSANVSSSSATETTAISQETTPTPTTPTKITATLPSTSSTEKSPPSQSTTSTTITTKKSSESTTSTTKKSSESTTSTTKKSSESTTTTTKKSSESTTSTTKKSSESTTTTTKKSSQSTTQSGEGSTQSSTPTTSIDNGGMALPSSGRGYGFCSFIVTPEECSNLSSPTDPITDPINHPIPIPDDCANGKCGDGSSTPVAVIVIVILLIAGLAAGIGGWVFYAYTHPTSRSGMWLMEHRPSQMKAKIQFWKSSSDSGAAKYKMESDA